jgi:hypothetical protein
MLYKISLGYEDGRFETKIDYKEPNTIFTIYPKRDKIRYSSFTPFKYEVEKHPTRPITIIHFLDKSVIYPAQIECHPKTTLKDIRIIETNILPPPTPKIEEPKQWKFKSSSSDGIYVVKQTPKGIKCDCPGSWRSKDKKCKHIREVEILLNKE